MTARRPEGRGDSITFAGVRLTHPDRILYPELGLTKLDLATYYRKVAERMLPHLAGRPLTLERCPEGTASACFFQKHATGGEPRSIHVFDFAEKEKTARAMSVSSLAGIVGLVQLGTLAIHVHASRRDRVERPDRFVLDLDPGPDVAVARIVALAHEVRARLEDVGLVSFVMATGGKGLHVVAPIQRRHGFEELRAFARALAERVRDGSGSDVVLEASKAKRKGRIYLDVLRNARGATAVCPYSTRARAAAPVAVPLPWNALESRLTAERVSVESIDAYLRLPDPWRDYFLVRQGLTKAIRALNARRAQVRDRFDTRSL